MSNHKFCPLGAWHFAWGDGGRGRVRRRHRCDHNDAARVPPGLAALLATWTPARHYRRISAGRRGEHPHPRAQQAGDGRRCSGGTRRRRTRCGTGPEDARLRPHPRQPRRLPREAAAAPGLPPLRCPRAGRPPAPPRASLRRRRSSSAAGGSAAPPLRHPQRGPAPRPAPARPPPPRLRYR